MFPSVLRAFGAKALAMLAVVLAMSALTAAHAAPVPSDDDQEVLVKSTLMTFNDANLTGNYTVLYDKASKPFKAQLSVQKLVDGFKGFREKKVNLASIVSADMDPGNKATINNDGVLNLKGRFKDDEKRIRFDLNFVYEDGSWKLLGIEVDYKQ
jgi:opacity protein-like surface antigen